MPDLQGPATELLQRLIRFDTVNPPGNERPAQEHLARLLADAESAGYRRISLETGVDERFEPARRLYTRRGFDLTGPFGTYPKNSQSVFMTLEL